MNLINPVGAGTIGTAQLANGAVTAAKIAANTITAAQIANNTITDTQLNTTGVAAGTYDLSKITVAASGRLSSAAGSGLVATVTTPGTPAAHSSTSYIMEGLAASITPTRSGKVAVSITGNSNGDNLDHYFYSIQYGTGGAPANNAAQTGTQVGQVIELQINQNGDPIPVSLEALITGLTLNTAYWVDVAMKATTGNAGMNLYNCTVLLEEV